MRTDKRVIKTRHNINIAFMQLMLERDFGSVSISDIAAKAQINRSTFYLHYNSLDDVMKDIENQIAERAADCIARFDINNLYGSIYDVIKKLTDILDEKPIWKSFITSSSVSSQVQHRVKDIFINRAMLTFLDDHPHEDAENALFAITYSVAGIFDSYVKWVTMPETNLTIDELILKMCTTSEKILGKMISSR